jgi:uncharacterized protein (TIGR03643 family)
LPEQISRIVRLAWEDRTSFEEIEKRTGFVERDVIAVMRRELKPSSFRLWRKRVKGRITKHRRLLERKFKGPPTADFDDSHRQGFAANTGLLESGFRRCGVGGLH